MFRKAHAFKTLKIIRDGRFLFIFLLCETITHLTRAKVSQLYDRRNLYYATHKTKAHNKIGSSPTSIIDNTLRFLPGYNALGVVHRGRPQNEQTTEQVYCYYNVTNMCNAHTHDLCAQIDRCASVNVRRDVPLLVLIEMSRVECELDEAIISLIFNIFYYC